MGAEIGLVEAVQHRELGERPWGRAVAHHEQRVAAPRMLGIGQDPHQEAAATPPRMRPSRAFSSWSKSPPSPSLALASNSA